MARRWAWGLGLLVLCSGLLRAQNPFRSPTGLAFDAAGDLFVADAGRNQVFEISLGGAVSVVAGTGVQGFGGDGGVATSALLNAPSGLAVGADGTLYITDSGNQRVRLVRGGVIATFAGSGSRGFGGDGGNSTAASFSEPMGLAIDSAGGLLIADSGNHRVRRVSGGIVTTFAGTGVQGFGGDGGAATAAVMDSPQAVAVANDGRVIVVDTRNNRIRVVGADGLMQTYAGNGIAGFAGDGGAAGLAAMFAPAGVAGLPSGALVVADAGNHRVRAVSSAGVITTLAGNGVQGVSSNASIATMTAMDTPVALAVSNAGDVVFADARSGAVFLVAADGTLRMLGVGASLSNLSLAPGPLTYGSGSLVASLVASGTAAEGTIGLMDAGLTVGTGTLNAGTATLSTALLSAGAHSLSASYAGDLQHAGAVSPAVNVVVAQLAVTATATAASAVYGAPLPALKGTLNGVLARDNGGVSATFTSSAADLAPVGNYAIEATLTGTQSGNYTVAPSATSAVLQVVQALPVLSLATQGSYAGLPILLSATVVSPTRGVPTGTVQFMDGGVVVASALLSGGSASAAYLNATAGTHALTAFYAGDHNFAAASSSVSGVVASALPDFTLAPTGSPSQVVQGGAIASYALLVTPQAGAFSGSVAFSATGLQPGAKVSFSPAAVVPGSGSVPVTMSIQTVALTGSIRQSTPVGLSLALGVVGITMLAFRKRRRVLVRLLCLGLLMTAGCGTRTVPTATKTAQTYNVVVTGTSTNLAGSVVTHTCAVTLTVE